MRAHLVQRHDRLHEHLDLVCEAGRKLSEQLHERVVERDHTCLLRELGLEACELECAPLAPLRTGIQNEQVPGGLYVDQLAHDLHRRRRVGIRQPACEREQHIEVPRVAPRLVDHQVDNLVELCIRHRAAVTRVAIQDHA